MIEAGIIQLLLADSTVAGLIDTRIYDVVAPDSPIYPCMSYQVVGGTTSVSIDNKATRMIRIQFDHFGETYSDAKALAAAVTNALEGFQGSLPDGTWVLDTTTGTSLDTWDDNAREFRTMQEFEFTYT